MVQVENIHPQMASVGNFSFTIICLMLRDMGFFNWIAPWLGVPLITAVGEGQRISTNHMLKRYPGVTLYRFDVQLDNGKGRIDDGSPENLNYLHKKA